MRYTITSQQFDHFHETGRIELTGIYSEEERNTLHELLEDAEKTIPSGRDLDRENPPLKNALKTSRLGQVVSQLVKKKRIKIAFTQYHPPYGEATLEEISCVSEVCGLALIDLEKEEVIFISEKASNSFPAKKPVLLVAFADEKARYKLQENDPHTHALKKLGYGFGDRLTEETHPLIVK